MARSSGELWDRRFMPDVVLLDCLLPSGVLCSLSMRRDATLRLVKDQLWLEARRRPLFRALASPDLYLFIGVTQDGEIEEFWDDQRHIADLRLFKPILKLISPDGDTEEKRISASLRDIGIPVNELDNLKSAEMVEYRRDMLTLAKERCELRDLAIGHMDLHFEFPPQVENDDRIPEHLRKALKDETLDIVVWVLSPGGRDKFRYNVTERHDARPQAVIAKAIPLIGERLRSFERKVDPSSAYVDSAAFVQQAPARYVLQVCGRSTYLLGNYPISQFRYIRSCMKLGRVPNLMLVNRRSLQRRLPKHRFVMPSFARRHGPPSPRQTISSWAAAVSREPAKGYSIRAVCAPFLHEDLVADMDQVYVRIGLFHGTEALCPVKDTCCVNPLKPVWNEPLTMEINLADIPRSAKLCASICAITRRSKRRTTGPSSTTPSSGERSWGRQSESSIVDEPRSGDFIEFPLERSDRSARTSERSAADQYPYQSSPQPPTVGLNYRSRRKSDMDEQCCLAWGNVNVYDHNGELTTDRTTLRMWPVPRGMTELLYPLGCVGANLDREAPALELELEPLNNPAVHYPEFLEAKKYAEMSEARRIADRNRQIPDDHTLTANDLAQLEGIVRRDPLYEVSEQEKDFLWRVRYTCLERRPNALPKLLDAVRWGSRDEVAPIYAMLKRWPIVPLVQALCLLDCKYPDTEVRRYAIKCIDSLTDCQVEQYLLQFVQILKHEQYLNSPLAGFLVRRAINNKRITHHLFWLLKTEMQIDPAMSLRYGVLLDAICRGCAGYLNELTRQVDAMEKLRHISAELRQRRDEGRPKWLTDQLQCGDYATLLRDMTSPLDCDDRLGKLLSVADFTEYVFCCAYCYFTKRHEKCYVLSSAKRPMWLVWRNPHPVAEQYFSDHEIIFKNGDDLRQDMLTLQAIRLMDAIWQENGIDLRMLPYGCVSTGANVGVIEVVRRASTVMQIQQSKKRGGVISKLAVDHSALHRWIQEKNPIPAEYERALDNFRRSCAGYCVATFILGIGDRHPDNIMVTEEGQIFHIDYGHFLGHFKKKFGINRERVPFVLTDDFVRVICASRGPSPLSSKSADSNAFIAFERLCVEAYAILRDQADLIITLFTMMLSTGIPELQSMSDLAYLRTTLAVDKSDEEAVEYFRKKFREAHDLQWTTKFDWIIHGLNHR